MVDRDGEGPSHQRESPPLRADNGAHRRQCIHDLDPNKNDLATTIPQFWPAQVRASSDGSVLYAEKDEGTHTKLFFDVSGQVAHGSAELTSATALTWVFDDLVVGVTNSGIVAFTPTNP